MKQMEIDITFEEIKQMSETKFKHLVKDSCKTISLKELTKKIKKKGKEI